MLSYILAVVRQCGGPSGADAVSRFYGDGDRLGLQRAQSTAVLSLSQLCVCVVGR